MIVGRTFSRNIRIGKNLNNFKNLEVYIGVEAEEFSVSTTHFLDF